ncbi:MAG: hypothetical protein AAGH48_01820 [Pseudomonadota bacterium]
MDIMFGEARPLMDWLTAQREVIGLWIDEVAATPDAAMDLLEDLEAHRAWLSERIDDLGA